MEGGGNDLHGPLGREIFRGWEIVWAHWVLLCESVKLDGRVGTVGLISEKTVQVCGVWGWSFPMSFGFLVSGVGLRGLR